MATLSEAYLSSAAKGHLRPLDLGHDLLAVADLVELCFADSLDPDGKDYLQQMREAARSSHLLHWANTYGEYGSMTLGGYVWEEAGGIIGNVSLVPFNSLGKRFFLIANVAVHPNFRGRGIGQALTAAALRYCRSRRVTAAWLQVREDNPVAIHIYKALGFSERHRRTTWLTSAEPREIPNGNGLTLGPRRSQHWLVQRSWLERIYPREMSWHLPVDWMALRPDFLGSVYRFFAFEYPKNWVVQRGNRLLGALTWKSTHTYADPLWLASPQNIEEEAIHALLVYARRQISRRRPLALNYPAGVASEAIRAAGFYPQQTLVWMENPFD